MKGVLESKVIPSLLLNENKNALELNNLMRKCQHKIFHAIANN